MVIVYQLMAMSGLKCAAALCGCATSYAHERSYVSSYYQYARVQRVGPAAELPQGRPCRSFLILLEGGSTTLRYSQYSRGNSRR